MEVNSLSNTVVDTKLETSPLVEAGEVPEIKYECKFHKFSVVMKLESNVNNQFHIVF